ncbi:MULTISPECIES: ABC-2 transporter permease [Clostridium]|jgi:ABC-2 type transport system permease protein|uniref:ABC-2 transporter permease n=1 Tax=Clostridium TaxID=1485 RepID=UPI002355907F|nr:ABC-2 transporter permease [Clostridium thermopalmarium]MBE6044419.1 ABC-2 transporter permease [Clostridium thermopalmarium]
MLNLVLKDFKLGKRYNIFLLVYSLMISAFGLKMDHLPGMLYVLSIVMLSYISILYSNGYDEKYKINIALNSMPINKKDIVRAKYLSLILRVLIVSCVIIIFTLILNRLGVKATVRTATFWDFILSFNLLGIFYSVYYPLYYKFEYNKFRIINMILYIILLVIPGYITKFLKSNIGLKFYNWIMDFRHLNQFQLFTSILVLIVLIISMTISSKIYCNKEF